MRVERFILVATVCGLVAGCSEDSGSHAQGLDGGGGRSSGGAAPRGDGGGAGTAAGAPSAGGAAFDAALVMACGIDAGVSPCRSCLAATCCDAVHACFADPTCAPAFDLYQACVVEQPEDVSACYSAFTIEILGASRVHEALLTCIAIGGCDLCGGPAVL